MITYIYIHTDIIRHRKHEDRKEHPIAQMLSLHCSKTILSFMLEKFIDCVPYGKTIITWVHMLGCFYWEKLKRLKKTRGCIYTLDNMGKSYTLR